MKSLRIVVLLMWWSPATLVAQEPSPASPTKGTFVIRGLHCPPCTSTLAASLKKAQGVKSVQVDWKTKNAWVDFDERVISAQQLAHSISTTPHMMGKNMRYSGSFVLKVPGLTDEANAAKAKQALSAVPGVAAVATHIKLEAVTIDFAPQGRLTSDKLIEALAAVGLEGASFR